MIADNRHKRKSVEPQRIAAILRRNRLLGVLNEEETAAFIALGKQESFAADAVIFEKGDPGNTLYAILNGQVAVTTTSEDGKMVLLNLLNAGDVLGEIALIDGRERTAGAGALGWVDLFRVERDDFIAFLEQRPKLAVRLMMVLCERLRWVSENMEDALFLDVPQRLAKRLLLLAELYGKPHGTDGVRIAQELSQENLANMLGVTREIVNKTITNLKKREIISYNKGYLIIHKIDILREMCG